MEKICLFCNSTFQTRGRRKYCFICQPKGCRKQLLQKVLTEKKCTKCKTIQEISNFCKRKRRRYDSYCKTCRYNYRANNRRNVKLKCVEYKGGKCEKCTYNKSYWALQFHHLTDKDFAISTKNASFEELKSELDKCALLCANCHAEQEEEKFLIRIGKSREDTYEQIQTSPQGQAI